MTMDGYCLRYYSITYLEELRKYHEELKNHVLMEYENKSGNNYTKALGTVVFNVCFPVTVANKLHKMQHVSTILGIYSLLRLKIKL